MPGEPSTLSTSQASRQAPSVADVGDDRPPLVQRAGPPLLLFVLGLGLWEFLTANGMISEYLLPRPWDIVTSFWGMVQSGLLLDNAWITVMETVVGFLVGGITAFVLAVACGLSPLIRKMLYPYMVAFQVTPRVAIAPMLIAALGFGYTPKIALAAMVCFFVIFLNTLTGFTSVDEESLELFRSLGASRWQVFRHLLLPGAMVMTFAGLKTGMTLALIGAIVAEFESARDGLGVLIQQFSFTLNIDAAFAVLLSLTVAGTLLYGIIEYLDRVVVFWARDESTAKRTNRRAAKARRAG